MHASARINQTKGKMKHVEESHYNGNCWCKNEKMDTTLGKGNLKLETKIIQDKTN